MSCNTEFQNTSVSEHTPQAEVLFPLLPLVPPCSLLVLLFRLVYLRSTCTLFPRLLFFPKVLGTVGRRGTGVQGGQGKQLNRGYRGNGGIGSIGRTKGTGDKENWEN